MRTAIVLALFLTACGDNVAPGPVDAACDLVSCEAGAAFECCPIAPPPTSRTVVLSPLVAAVASGWVPDFGAPSSLSRGCMRATGLHARFALPIPLEHGDRMRSLVVAIDGDDSSDIMIGAALFTPSVGTISSIGEAMFPNAAAGWRDYTIVLVDTVVDGAAWSWIDVVADRPGACVGAFRLTYERAE